MAKIVPNALTLHEGQRYEKGKEYDVDEGLAMYFRNNGWLTDSEDVTTDADVTLDIDDITQDTEVK
jgi:hypothetical protein